MFQSRRSATYEQATSLHVKCSVSATRSKHAAPRTPPPYKVSVPRRPLAWLKHGWPPRVDAVAPLPQRYHGVFATGTTCSSEKVALVA
eukprot:scaffold71566_cov30-Tisochrysis_lutea.AAC.1